MAQPSKRSSAEKPPKHERARGRTGNLSRALVVEPAAPPPPAPPAASSPDSRAARTAERRQAILLAAIDEFAARGFAAARLEDVAKRAGVAKGTIYLYFADKETLFQELVRSFLVPQVAMLEAAPAAAVPIRTLLERFLARFISEIYETKRRDVLQLMLTEGHRFPTLAEFYYHAVVERALSAMRAILAAAETRGELPTDSLVRFPQLLVSPIMMALVWSTLFERFAPLDIRELLDAHLDLIFAERKAP